LCLKNFFFSKHIKQYTVPMDTIFSVRIMDKYGKGRFEALMKTNMSAKFKIVISMAVFGTLALFVKKHLPAAGGDCAFQSPDCICRHSIQLDFSV